jgi:predicted Zn-dependent peptidase
MNILESIKHREKTYKSTQLVNGIKIFHVPLEHDSRFFIAAYFKAGSCLETTDNSGISHFLEHMMFRGSKNFSSFNSIAYAFEKLGGQWNAATGHEYTEFSYDGLTESYKDLIPLFAEFIQQPRLLDLEKERKIILREIEDELNEYGYSTDTHYHMLKLFWPTTSLAQPITGTADSMEKITLDQLWKYYKTHYHPENMTLCVIGGRTEDHILESLEKNFQDFISPKQNNSAKFPTVGRYSGPQCKWVNNSDNQYNVQLSFLCAGEWSSKHEDYVVLSHLLTDGFSSLLSSKLREELGLVYDIESSVHFFVEQGVFSIHTSTLKENTLALIEALLQTLNHFLHEGPLEKDLEKAKNRATADLSNILYSFESLSYHLARKSQWNQPTSIMIHYDKIKYVNRESLLGVAKELFCKQNTGVVVLGPPKKNIEQDIIQLIHQNL